MAKERYQDICDDFLEHIVSLAIFLEVADDSMWFIGLSAESRRLQSSGTKTGARRNGVGRRADISALSNDKGLFAL